MKDINFEEIESTLSKRYSNNVDPWGLDPSTVLKNLKLMYPIYRQYFNVKLHNLENIDSAKTYMVVSNHTGQIPIDAILICCAFAFELDQPIFLRSLIERFMTSLPFIGKWSSESGAVLGDRNNCINLLKRNESILVFPEGVNGIAKSPHEFYKTKPFTKGFLRMASQGDVEILPICVIGAEEFYPFVFHSKKLANFLKVPALPITPNLIPLPSPVDIYIGKPLKVAESIDLNATDEAINPILKSIEVEIESMIKLGLSQKRTIKERFF